VTREAPRRISDREVARALTGYFMPTASPQVPVLVGMPGTDDLFVCVFSTEAKLVAAMSAFGIGYEGVAVVNDDAELLEGLREVNARGGRPYRIRLAVDLHKVDDGRGRFAEVWLDLDELSPLPVSN